MNSPGVSLVDVDASGEGVRLDRWLKARYPGVNFAVLQRLIRTGQVRIDGHRSPASTRLCLGQKVRIPPVGLQEKRPRTESVSIEDAAMLTSRVLYRDEELLAIDKPAGLAVQGGTGIRRHLDMMLNGLRFGAPERPRLVHRLDKDTTGVLLLARSLAAARHCAKAFRDNTVDKTYWALVRGRPNPATGAIDFPLVKTGAGGDRRARAVRKGQSANTSYRTRKSGKGASWVEFHPGTGRMHQIRAHAAAIGCPILGDSRYGLRKDANTPLQLHARDLALPGLDGLTVRINAPLPAAMKSRFTDLGIPLPSEENDSSFS